MKPLLVFASSLVFLCFPCLGQRRAAGGVTYVTPSGYGNVAYPGTGGPSATFASRLGATVAGVPLSGKGLRAGQRYGGGLGGYPLYVGGAYVPSYAPDYSDQTQLAPTHQQQYAAPPVVINQYFGAPPPMDPVTAPNSTFYQPSAQRPLAAEEPAPASQFYLLAFKDHSVYSARAYWIEDKTLHYVTPQNTHNQASLDLVDVDFTKQLNRNQDVPFTIQPAPAK